jgi:hypothetical protein
MALSLTTNQTVEVQLRPALKSKLLKRLKLYAELRAQSKALELAMDKEKAEIGALREEAGVDKLAIEGFSVAYVTNIRKTLIPAKLIAMGVTTSMLEEATDLKPGRPYVKISVPGQKEYNEE